MPTGKCINQLQFHLKSSKNHKFPDDFRGNRNSLIRLNLLNIRRQIRRRKLLVRGWITNFSAYFVPFSQTGGIKLKKLVFKYSTCALNIFFLVLSDSKYDSWYSFSREVVLIVVLKRVVLNSLNLTTDWFIFCLIIYHITIVEIGPYKRTVSC